MSLVPARLLVIGLNDHFDHQRAQSAINCHLPPTGAAVAIRAALRTGNNGESDDWPGENNDGE
ncbi:MAG: hypothetical protein ABIL58_04765 [Pseudomonadota bacterium]